VAEKIDGNFLEFFDKPDWKSKRLLAATVSCALNFSKIFPPFIFIDEASQLLEIPTFAALLKLQPLRLMCVGDPLQLPPVFSKKSLLDRLIARNLEISFFCRNSYRRDLLPALIQESGSHSAGSRRKNFHVSISSLGAKARVAGSEGRFQFG